MLTNRDYDRMEKELKSMIEESKREHVQHRQFMKKYKLLLELQNGNDGLFEQGSARERLMARLDERLNHLDPLGTKRKSS